jgi:hypothetical protein
MRPKNQGGAPGVFPTAIILVGLVFASRIPFLAAGYGREPDAWRIAVTARAIATTGTYVMSRPPGYPIPEIAYSLLWDSGPLVFNGLTAVFSGIATVFFWLYVRKVFPTDALLTSLAFAFTPVVFVNSTNSKDYLWALAFVMTSWYLSAKNRSSLSWHTLAGVALGLGIGSRLTSAAMIAPLLLSLSSTHPLAIAMKHGVALLVGAALTSVMALSPVWLTNGWEFLTFADNPRYPEALLVTRRATEGVWGRLGMVALVLAGAGRLLWPRPPAPCVAARRAFLPCQLLGAWGLAVALYVAAFLRLPHQSGYLIPIVPFTLLLLASFLPRALYRSVCVSLILSSFVTLGWHGIQQGPVFLDQQVRQENIRFARALIKTIEGLPEGSAVVVGWYLPMIEALAGTREGSPGLLSGSRLLYLADKHTLDTLSRRGIRIYYLAEASELNALRHGVDLHAYGATRLAP